MATPPLKEPTAVVGGQRPQVVRHWHIPGTAWLRSSHGLQRVMLITGLVIIVVFVLAALCAQWIAPYGYAQLQLDPAHPLVNMFPTLAPPSAQHLWGTTIAGYDVLSRTVWGARTALEVIVIAVVLSSCIGVPLGVISGYVGGPLDRVLVLITDALYAFPSLLLAIVVSIVISGGSSGVVSGILSAAISITVVFVPQYFRVTRNETLRVKTEPYVDAARVVGTNPFRIMFGHILANVSQTLPVLVTLNASESILTLAGLGFLGFGVQPTAAAEWGYDLSQAMNDATNGVWWTAVCPGVAIVLVVAGVTLVGESLNDVLNPLLRTRGGESGADAQEIAETAALGEQLTASAGLVPSGAAHDEPGGDAERGLP